jgi:Bacterial Ig domain
MPPSSVGEGGVDRLVRADVSSCCAGTSCDGRGTVIAVWLRSSGELAGRWGRSAAAGSLLVISLLTFAGLPASPAMAETAYRLEQRAGESTSILTVSSTGLRYELLAPQRAGGRKRGHRARPLLGTVIRYSDLALLLLDPPHKSYQRLALKSTLASYESELAGLQKAGPSNVLPPPPGVAAPSVPNPLKQPPARLHALSLSRKIGPLTARAFEVRQGTLRERLWYAAALPAPPPSVSALLAGALSKAGSGTLGRVLGTHADQIPLRVEDLTGRHWVTVIQTNRVSRTALAGTGLRPPRGYHAAGLLAAGGAVGKAADVPADPIRCGLGVNCLVPGLVGPVSTHPSVWAIYWGPHFAERSDVVSSLNHALEDYTGDQFADPASRRFWEPLAQYGVERGTLQGYEVDGGKPDRSVGSSNVFDVAWEVLSHRFHHGEPDYWWRFAGNDPIYALFVDESEVDSSGWGGYHAFAPTEGILFFFLVHPALPFFIVKVPDIAGLSNDHASAAYRSVIDTASERASHEFVEAATDPYPFLSWADPLKEPIWENGEIADICELGVTFPWGKRTRIQPGGLAVSPYWSNNDHACVPEARPQIHTTFPPAESTVFWDTSATFVMQGEDAFDGSIPDSEVRWVSDLQGVIGHGNVLTTTQLNVGEHIIWAEVRDSTGGFAETTPVRVKVVARPPTAQIHSPAEGTTFGSNQTINFRGAASDPSEGDLSARATWSVDGTQVGTGASLLRYRIPTEGEHTVTLAVTNDAHLSASTSIKVTIGPPVKGPSVSIISPNNEEAFSELPPKPINFTGVAEGVEPFTYRWTDEPGGLLSTEKSFTYTFPGLCEIATFHIKLEVTDGDAEKGSDSVTIKVGTIC